MGPDCECAEDKVQVGPNVIRANIAVPGSAGDKFGMVNNFTYLGNTVSNDGELDTEITGRP